MADLAALSKFLGWSYFVCWGLASYPPIFLNIRLRSVEGISLDFLYINIVGYICYTTSLSMLYFNSAVREEYAFKHTPQTIEDGIPHPKNYPLIQINDVAYTVHGLLCALVVYSQVHFFAFKKNKHQHVSRYTQLLLATVCSLCLLMCATVLYFPRMTRLHLLDVAEILAYVKVLMSTIKHIPQLLYNHKRRSTKGWAINATILDVAGALFSIFQLILDAYRTHHMENIYGNSSKLSLALVTIAFNIMFLIQHFILYPSSRYPDVIRLDEIGGGAYDNAVRAGAFNSGVINDSKSNPGGPLNIRVGVHSHLA